jgi:hypothetical protein
MVSEVRRKVETLSPRVGPQPARGASSSCRTLAANAFRFQRLCPLLQSRQFHADAGAAQGGGKWSLSGLREKLTKIGAKVLSQGRWITFFIAQVVGPDRCSMTT